MNRRPRSFWIALLVGWVVIGYGAVGVLRNADTTKPIELVRWFVGAGVAHDAVLAPVAVGVGWLTLRIVPERARVPVRLALAATALLVAFTWPYVHGYGVTGANPSVLPFAYGRNLAWSVAGIWLLCVAAVVRPRSRPNQREP